MVVIAPDHRDGSAPLAIIHESQGDKGKVVDYMSIPHAPSRETEDARDQQLKIRLWELDLLYEVLLKMNEGERLLNTAVMDTHSGIDSHICDLSMFKSSLDVHKPGGISWSGHSFGATTVFQFVKSVFYRPSLSSQPSYRPLYVPAENSPITRQITPFSSISLLDLWTLPLRSDTTRWLWNQSLPSYTTGGPGGSNIIAILSEAFLKWRGNLIPTKRAISADPTNERPSTLHGQTPPHIFYPATSAHLSQSDFGILFPFLTKRFLKAQEPERTLKLNVRAILEVLRLKGTELADTSENDMEVIYNISNSSQMNGHTIDSQKTANNKGHTLGQDHKILATDGSVRGWESLDLDEESRSGEATNKKTQVNAEPSQAVIDGEVMTVKEERSNL
ncbi:hypothetical protein MMC06_006437 [Schaereria dolodes]|nr:hypothetical protein [Schaereria dolodes]